MFGWKFLRSVFIGERGSDDDASTVSLKTLSSFREEFRPLSASSSDELIQIWGNNLK